MNSHLYKTIFGLLTCFVCVSSANGEQIIQPPLPDSSYSDPRPSCDPREMSISELLNLALQNNPETMTAWWNANRAAASADTAKSAYYPSIGFRATLVNGLDYRYINGQKTNYTTASGDIVLNYLLYDFGERTAASQAAKAALAAANWQSDWTLQRVMYQVIENTHLFLNAQEKVTSRLESLKDAMKSLEAAKELQRAGLRSITDIYSLEASVADMEIGITLQKAEAMIAGGKLAASMGLDVDTELLIAPLEDPQLDQVMQEGLLQLISAAHQKRSDLMAKRSDVAKQVALEKKTGKACFPKLNARGDTGYRRYFEDKSTGFNYNAGLYLEVPIFKGFEQIYLKKAALSDVRLSQIELEKLELAVALEVLTYSQMFKAAQEILHLAGKFLLNSNKTFQGVMEKYQAGTISIFELTTAQNQLAEARLKNSDAKTRWYRSLAQLAYATGSIIPNTEVPCITVE